MSILNKEEIAYFVIESRNRDEFYDIFNKAFYLGYITKEEYVSLESKNIDIMLDTDRKEISVGPRDSHSHYYHLDDQENNYEYFTYEDFIIYFHQADKAKNDNSINLSLVQLERIMNFTKDYLSYYDYTRILGDNKVETIIKNRLCDKFIDVNELEKDYKNKLHEYGISVKGHLLE